MVGIPNIVDQASIFMFLVLVFLVLYPFLPYTPSIVLSLIIRFLLWNVEWLVELLNPLCILKDSFSVLWFLESLLTLFFRTGVGNLWYTYPWNFLGGTLQAVLLSDLHAYLSKKGVHKMFIIFKCVSHTVWKRWNSGLGFVQKPVHH